jgi:hypothetical protein
MKEIKFEEGRTLMECLSCGKKGYYPVGGLGCIEAEEVTEYDNSEVLYALQMACEHDIHHQAQALRTWLPRIKEWHDKAHDLENAKALVRSFDAAIQHIAAPLGIACGGVDTVDEINQETGKPYGPGGHTGWVLTKAVTDLQEKAEALELAFGHYHVNKNDGTDICSQCGFDLRNTIHYRKDDSRLQKRLGKEG